MRYLKGQSVDAIGAIVSVFVFIIAMAAIYWVWTTLATPPVPGGAANLHTVLTSTQTGNTVVTGVSNAENIFNNAGMVLLIGMALGAIVLAALSEGNIAVIFISVIMLLPQTLLSFFLHDIFTALAQSSFFGSALSTSSLLVFQFFTAICLGLWFFITLMTFSK